MPITAIRPKPADPGPGSAEVVAEALGLSEGKGSIITNDLELVEAVRDGLPVNLIARAVSAGLLSPSEVDRLIIPRRTLSHRLRDHEGRLSKTESDHLTRVIRAISLATETLGTAEKSHRWLRKSNKALGGGAPLDLLDTDGGARLVEQVLGRIAYGVYE
ncbi:MAG: antitoxin Xre/MbcA/ParS toxin-binding domain-containing protein [Gemmatimonadaceae bacterium]